MTWESLQCYIKSSSSSTLKNLLNQLIFDLSQLENGIFPSIPVYLPEKSTIFQVFKEIYSTNLFILDLLMSKFLKTSVKISFNSSEFNFLTEKVEVLSQVSKYFTYQKFSLSIHESPVQVILSRSIHHYSSEDPEFPLKLKEMEEDHQAMTEILLDLIQEKT
jgi:hypothetical protein